MAQNQASSAEPSMPPGLISTPRPSPQVLCPSAAASHPWRWGVHATSASTKLPAVKNVAFAAATPVLCLQVCKGAVRPFASPGKNSGREASGRGLQRQREESRCATGQNCTKRLVVQRRVGPFFGAHFLRQRRSLPAALRTSSLEVLKNLRGTPRRTSRLAT